MIEKFKSRPGRKIVQRPAGESGPVQRFVIPTDDVEQWLKERGLKLRKISVEDYERYRKMIVNETD